VVPPVDAEGLARDERGLGPDQEAHGRRHVFDGAHALTACAKRYHMASLWEIFNVSTLRYNDKLGDALEDSGSGPPAGVGGWIRTGSVTSTGNQAGLSNCGAWTSSANAALGTTADLPISWGAGGTVVSPWEAGAVQCSGEVHVWCVAN